MITAIDHLNIVVADLDRSVRFYTELLGFRLIKEAQLEGEWIDRIVGLKGVKGQVAYVVAPAGEPRIELLHYESPTMRVDDIAAMTATLRAAGVDVLSDPVKVPHGVVNHDQGEKTLVYFRDPDGVVLELAEYR